MRARLGAIVHLYSTSHDGWSLEEGDFLRTSTGRCYKVEHVRQRQQGAGQRITMKCRVLEDDAVQEGEPGVWSWRWNSRDKR